MSRAKLGLDSSKDQNKSRYSLLVKLLPFTGSSPVTVTATRNAYQVVCQLLTDSKLLYCSHQSFLDPQRVPKRYEVVVVGVVVTVFEKCLRLC